MMPLDHLDIFSTLPSDTTATQTAIAQMLIGQW